MADEGRWRLFWEDTSKGNAPDFEVDRLRPSCDQQVDDLSGRELLNFIDARKFETLLDAGCGTGINILRLHSIAQNIIGMDYAHGMLDRCRKRIRTEKVTNAHVCLGSVSAIPLPNSSVDGVLCLSVLHYLNDDEARQALRELVRVLSPGGTISLHVKNSSSLYWSTLLLAKRVKNWLGGTTRRDFVRPFRWYVRELASLNCTVVDFSSLNTFVLEGMPNKFVSLVQRFELKHRDSAFFRVPFIRRHGAELKIKGRRMEGKIKLGLSQSKTAEA